MFEHLTAKIRAWRSVRYTNKHFTAMDVPFLHVNRIYICNYCGAYHSLSHLVQHHSTCTLPRR